MTIPTLQPLEASAVHPKHDGPHDDSAGSERRGDAVALRTVGKSFGAVQAVRDLSLTIHAGETTALLGPNGAGKTTTLCMILGLLDPDRGSVTVFGSSPRDAVASGRVGAMLQDGGLMQGVRVAELLAMLGAQYPRPLGVADACSLAQLDGLEGRRVDRLSGGQTQKLRLAIALIGNPDLLVLDEPTAGMDVEARRRFWRAMDGETARGRSILFSTHYLEEADVHADRVVVIGAGRVLADGTPASVKAAVAMRALRFTVTQPSAAEFLALPGVTGADTRGDRVELRSTDTDATLRALLARRADARDIDITGIGLEDAFIALTDAAATPAMGENR